MRRFGLILAIALCAPLAAQAEVRLGGGGYAERQAAPRIDQWVLQAREVCQWYAPKWRVDCLRDQLALVAGKVPKSGSYAALRAGMWRAVERLDGIAVQNADPQIAPTRNAPRREGAGQTPRAATALRATAPARQARANAAASAALDELATTLLRAAPQGAARAQFTATSRAIEGTKQLLRSA